MRSPLLILLATGALAVTAACGASEEEVPVVAPSPTGAATPTPVTSSSPAATDVPAVTPTPAVTPGPGVTLWRWGDVVVLVPDASAIHVTRDNSGDSPTGGPSITLARGDSGIRIDANTGMVFESQIQEADQSDLEAVVTSIRLAKPGESLPWPYDTQKPDEPKKREFNIMYWEPSPAAGLIVGFMVLDFAPSGDKVVYIESTRSRRLIDAQTGEILRNNDHIEPDDEEAIERWTAAVDVMR